MTIRRKIFATIVFSVSCLIVAAGSLVVEAATPAPSHGLSGLEARMRNDAHRREKLHTEFVVETNDRGQVTRVRSGKSSTSPVFNAMTYGNALQTFFRLPDGSATAGVFRLRYDYSPTDGLMRRDVELLYKGGVNPKAEGAVFSMLRAGAVTSQKQAQHK